MHCFLIPNISKFQIVNVSFQVVDKTDSVATTSNTNQDIMEDKDDFDTRAKPKLSIPKENYINQNIDMNIYLYLRCSPCCNGFDTYKKPFEYIGV